MSTQATLPIDAPTQVELVLTEPQIEAFSGIIQLQRLNPGSQTFMVLASSYEPEFRKGVLRLQGKLVPKREAQRALNILRKAELQ